jgi:DNA-binding MarR family transcriptional regulator
VSKYSREGPGRHQPLEEKVERIAEGLATSSAAKFKSGDAGVASNGDEAELSQESVHGALRAWQERACYLPDDLLFDPAWGMLLELLEAEIARRPVTLSMLSGTHAISKSGGARWVSALEERRLVSRRADRENPADELVELTPEASAALRRYFREVVLSH